MTTSAGCRRKSREARGRASVAADRPWRQAPPLACGCRRNAGCRRGRGAAEIGERGVEHHVLVHGQAFAAPWSPARGRCRPAGPAPPSGRHGAALEMDFAAVRGDDAEQRLGEFVDAGPTRPKMPRISPLRAAKETLRNRPCRGGSSPPARCRHRSFASAAGMSGPCRNPASGWGSRSSSRALP